MWHLGIDLHRVTVVIAAAGSGWAAEPVRIDYQDSDAILRRWAGSSRSEP